MDKVTLPIELKKMAAVFTENGFQLYLVGGAVRDIIRGKKPTDWDVATNALPQDVLRLFKKVIPTGIEHGTVTVLFMGHHIETTTFRTERDYTDGRHPGSVDYTATIEEDLSRRDFTMNAIAVSIPEGCIIDPFHGREDIRTGYIRTVGSPEQRFSEDGLRPIRALRFSAQLQFDLDKALVAAIPAALPVIRKISIERFRDEFIKILGAETPSAALRMMDETGILELFIPELHECRDVEQRGAHQFDVFDHLLYACDGAPKDDLTVRLAALFHDIGKPGTRALKTIPENGERVYTFYNHEKLSAAMTQKILERLRFPKAVIAEVSHLVSQHMFHYEENWSDAAVRRFVSRAGADTLERLFALRLADVYGMDTQPLVYDPLSPLRARIECIQKDNSALSIRDLDIDGRDLLNAGIPSGPHMGLILNELLETVLDDPAMNTKDRLLVIALNLYKKCKGKI